MGALDDARQARQAAEQAGDTVAWARARAREVVLMGRIEESFDPVKHPRDRQGRWRETLGALARETGTSRRALRRAFTAAAGPRSTLGVTAYYKTDDPSYPRKRFKAAKALFDESKWQAKWGRFEADIDRLAAEHGVTVVGRQRTVGVYEGEFEPSYSIEVTGSTDAVEAYNAALGRKWNQDAVVGFTPDPEGDDANIELDGLTNQNEVLRSLKTLGVDGATFTPDGSSISIFVAGDDAKTVRKVGQYAKAHAMVVSHTRGRGSYLQLKEARVTKRPKDKSPALKALEEIGSTEKPATGATTVIVKLGK